MCLCPNVYFDELAVMYRAEGVVHNPTRQSKHLDRGTYAILCVDATLKQFFRFKVANNVRIITQRHINSHNHTILNLFSKTFFA